MQLIEEMKRRNVFRVGAAYVILGWLIVQVTDTVSPALNLPEWTLGLVTWLGIIGFPFALFFAWAFELTPEGIRREADAPDTPAPRSATDRKLDIALIALLLITIVYMIWQANDDDSLGGEAVNSAALVTPGSDADQSIAVLPLINMSADTENAYFAGGVHEEILTNLSRIEGLRVVSRTTALRYLESPLSLQQIGAELGVRYIVEGSVRRVNDHVRITVQLIDASNDAHLWASNYDRELKDVFAVQSEVAATITNSLHLEVQPESVGTLNDMPTHSVKAYDLYSKSLSIVRSEPESEDALRRQRTLLEGALAEDSDFVEAWALLNEVLDHSSRNVLQNHWFGDSEQEREQVLAEFQAATKVALDKAVTLGPDNVETLLAQASDYVREQQSAEFQIERKQYIDRALELEPDNAYAWLVLAWWHRLTGTEEEATQYFHRALELDPLNASIVDSALIHFRLIGDQEMTTLLFERLAQIAPEKGSITELGEIHPIARIDNLLALFGQTADEALIQDFADLIDDLAPTIRNAPLSEQLHARIRVNLSRLTVLQMQNRAEDMLLLALTEVPPDAPGFEVFLSLWELSDTLTAAMVLGDADRADSLAQRLLERRQQLGTDSRNSGFQQFIELPMTTAYTHVEDEDALAAVRATYENVSDEFLFGELGGPIYGYSRVDIDATVERILEHKAAYPAWHGTDWIAIAHIVNRHLLLHPDIQAFLVEEGKWTAYLAERVPEYAQYRQ